MQFIRSHREWVISQWRARRSRLSLPDRWYQNSWNVICEATPRLSIGNLGVEGYRQMRTKHPKKEVERALAYAERHGWRVDVGGSHCWGKLYCPANDIKCRSEPRNLRETDSQGG